jgi:hypothetical protein
LGKKKRNEEKLDDKEKCRERTRKGKVRIEYGKDTNETLGLPFCFSAFLSFLSLLPCSVAVGVGVGSACFPITGNHNQQSQDREEGRENQQPGQNIKKELSEKGRGGTERNRG